jgi:hypothetical protein
MQVPLIADTHGLPQVSSLRNSAGHAAGGFEQKLHGRLRDRSRVLSFNSVEACALSMERSAPPEKESPFQT